jgi:hypothetical protein
VRRDRAEVGLNDRAANDAPARLISEVSEVSDFLLSLYAYQKDK